MEIQIGVWSYASQYNCLYISFIALEFSLICCVVSAMRYDKNHDSAKSKSTFKLSHSLSYPICLLFRAEHIAHSTIFTYNRDKSFLKIYNNRYWILTVCLPFNVMLCNASQGIVVPFLSSSPFFSFCYPFGLFSFVRLLDRVACSL